MTIFGWDGSKWDDGIAPTAAEWQTIKFMIWRSSIGATVDPTFAWAYEQAHTHQIPFAAYHFPLETHRSNGTSPPVSAARQLDALQRACPDTSVPIMFDWEANQNQSTGQIYNAPKFDDVLRVADAFQSGGYSTTLLYTGDYYWQEKGSPTLSGHGFDLVNAHYGSDAVGTAQDRYNAQKGDSGAGWVGYGGLEPLIWQFGSQIRFARRLVDMNAIREPVNLGYWFKTGYGDNVSAPRTKVTVPTFLKGASNGRLDPTWLRSPDEHTGDTWKMFVPVSYAMQAMHLAAEKDGVELRSSGRYRTYERQVALFLERYSPSPIAGRPTKTWNGKTYWQKQGVAMAATPGTSNHGLGLADDVSEDDSAPEDLVGESLNKTDIIWLDEHQTAFGFGLETPAEQWHRHWVGNNTLTQVTVDTLHEAGYDVPDLTRWGFTAPDPTPGPTPPPKEDDDMALFVARLESNPNLLLMGNGVSAQAIRSAQIATINKSLAAGNGPDLRDPTKPGRPAVTKLGYAGSPDVPTLNGNDMAALVGLETYESLVTRGAVDANGNPKAQYP